MELFIAVIVTGVMVYEFYSGAIIVQNGARAKAVSRASRPGHFWFWIIVQMAIVVFILLEWFNITHVNMFS